MLIFEGLLVSHADPPGKLLLRQPHQQATFPDTSPDMAIHGVGPL